MKKTNLLFVVLLSVSIIFSGCKSLNNASKGGILGGTTGAAIGAGVGALLGKDGKSAAIGAAIGGAVGTTAGVIIGKKMDKAAEEAAKVEGAQVETVQDANGLKAVKVTFDSGILFATGKSTLNKASKDALTKFSTILNENSTMDISIYGHTDNTGSLDVNKKLSQKRAQSVADFLALQKVNATQFKEITGKDYSEPVADNATVEGRQQNRRVEVFMYASETMIKEAETQAKP